MRLRFAIASMVLLAAFSPAQDSSDKSASQKAASDKNAVPNPPSGESSSRQTRIDLSPPTDDSKSHPHSEQAVEGLGLAAVSNKSDISDIQEFHPWNPLKARKDIDVGDFYFRRKNYKAALDRYREALYYKDGDAVANFRVAECQEKLGNKAEAKNYFEQYLKILPEGPLAKEAHSKLDKLAKSQ